MGKVKIHPKNRHQMALLYLWWCCLCLSVASYAAVSAQKLMSTVPIIAAGLKLPAQLMTTTQPISAVVPQVKSVASANTAKPLLKLSTLEWPPYTSPSLPGQGETSRLLRQVFQAMGYQVQIQVMPWTDAMAVVKQRQGFDGFFPEYPLSEPNLVQSAAIGYSELGLVEPVKSPLLLTSMQQLAGLKIGVVEGYLNMSELDVLIDAGHIVPIRHRNDRDNILQVMAGKLDAAVIDKRVLQHLLKHDADLALRADEVQFSQSFIEHRSLHLVLPDTVENKLLLQQFNQTLLQFKTKFVGTGVNP